MRDARCMDDDRNDGVDSRGSRYLISDRELDALAEAAMAFERWEKTRRWWLVGCIDGARDVDREVG